MCGGGWPQTMKPASVATVIPPLTSRKPTSLEGQSVLFTLYTNISGNETKICEVLQSYTNV